MSDNIKVVVKLRPLIAREVEDKLPHQWRVEHNSLYQLDSNGRDLGNPYVFDKVYTEDTLTQAVYKDVAKPIVDAAVEGFNGTIFAYGQTSSGKTYTMTGTNECPGIIPLTVLDLFQSIKNIPNRDFVVSVSYIEIYNENVRDLLDEKKALKIQETSENSIKLGAKDIVTASPDEVLDAMKKGNAIRQIGSTKMNEGSSRSHTIFQINIESRQHVEGSELAGCVHVAQLNLVDLAGSERAGQTGATGQQFKEGTNINKSLSFLGLVIKQLSENQRYVNCRDSKLTRILQNSLGGNAKTSIICAVTPAVLEETISTLQFATRAKAIKNKPQVNAVTTDETMIQKLTKELSVLQSQLESKKNIEQMLESKKNNEQNLQKQIANLQRFILNGFGAGAGSGAGSGAGAGAEAGGARRRPPPARRVTISTTSLHPIDENSPAVPSRKFCTPSLKYNPALIQMPDSNIVPIQNPGKLQSLPEEPPRLKTPPPSDLKVSDEIIELDSDDDDSASIQTCSPHHYCYGSSKTPPCVLRKNARLAERDLKDLVELTEREKMFTPSVVELLEKLEISNARTMELQDEIELIKTSSVEKDLEIESLKTKIRDTDLEIKSLSSATSEIEAQRDSCITKLTEWEVSYERQKNKAKLREAELLSLLDEKKTKTVEDISKVPFKPKDREIVHLMDMSKDISLVNSDNESSVIQTEEDVLTDQRSILLNEMQTQLTAKNDQITVLQSNLEIQKIQIESLEKSSHGLLEEVNSFKEKLSYFEKENMFLQSTVKELNSTIKIQKDSMELAQNDMKSYNSVIQELQIKLSKKDTVLNVDISDDFIENLFSNEDKTIANNENLKNIVHSFKRALDNSKKEIDLLKSQMSSDNQELLLLVNDDIAKLTKRDQENIVTINKLMREKTDLAHIEQEYFRKISEVDLKISENEKFIKEQAAQIDSLKNVNSTLEASIVDNLNMEKEHSYNLNLCLQKNLNTLQHIFSPLSEESSISLDRLILNVDSLQEKFNILETQAMENVSEKDVALKNCKELQKELDKLMTQHKSMVTELTENMEHLNAKVLGLQNEINLMGDKYSEKLKETEYLKLELEKRNHVYNDNSEKDAVISLLQKNEGKLSETIEKLNKDISKNDEDIQELQEDCNLKILKLKHLEKEAQLKENKLVQCQQELINVKKITNLQFDRLTEELNFVIEKILEINPSLELKLTDNVYEQISHYVKIISKYVFHQSPIFVENEKLKSDMSLLVNNNKSIKNDFQQSSKLLSKVQEELKMKSDEISDIENKAKEYKTLFTNFDEQLKEEMSFLKLENEKLKDRIAELTAKTTLQPVDENNFDSYKTTLEKSDFESKSLNPQSLLTICCDIISKAIDSKQSDVSYTTSSSYVSKTCSINISEYENLLQQLSMSQQENIRLLDYVEQLEIENKSLVSEQLETQNEVKLLINETEDLQKKLYNHKTILTILTATTYTENKSLQSQLKGLQHHHSRFHNVCQRDIPGFKKQLNDLMSVLRDDASNYDLIINNKAISQENTSNNILNNKNESTLDGDLLMLDSNLTITTADITLAAYNQTCLDYSQTMLNETGPALEHSYTDNKILSKHNVNVNHEIEKLKKEIDSLKKQLDNTVTKSKVDAHCSPLKSGDYYNKKQHLEELDSKIISLTEQLAIATKEKEVMEKRYSDLLLEMPSVDLLVKKIKVLEEDLSKENEKNNNLRKQCKELQDLQNENDTLSTQLMEQISETDDLNKKIEVLKQQNIELTAQCQLLNSKINVIQEDESKGIKEQLNNSNMSMDLDDSMNFEMARDSVPSTPQSKKCIIPDIQEERPLDLYNSDKNECFNFYLTKTETDTDQFLSNAPIIEIMSKLYNTLVTRHCREIENHVNKLKVYEETQSLHETRISDLNAHHLEIKNQLDQSETKLKFINDVIYQLRTNLHIAKECNADITSVFKDKFLTILDQSFNLTSVDILEKITDHTKKLVEDCDTINKDLSRAKYELSEKEKECNLLKATNDKIQEINKAVTLDIIQKEKDDKASLEKIYQKLLELNLNSLDKMPLSNGVTLEALTDYIEYLIKEQQDVKSKDVSEINKLTVSLNEKKIHFQELLSKVELLESSKNQSFEKLKKYEEIIQSDKVSELELQKELKTISEENDRNVKEIVNLSEEIQQLKQTINNKDEIVKAIVNKQSEASELLSSVQCLQYENDKLKAMNEIISKEAKSYAIELEKSCAIIEQNNRDLDKMTSEILVLRESVKEASVLVDSLKEQVQTLTDENIEIKRDLEIKSRDCYRLEVNIKTHEKTAEIQSRMITRLKDENKVNIEIQQKMKELSTINEALQKECEELRNTVIISSQEIQHLKTTKESLESRLAEFEDSGRRSRTSLDAVAESSKRRRQSLHDSKRMFEKLEENKNIEAVFGSRHKPDDLFMDIDDESLSGRSTPQGLGKGRDSRSEISDKDEDSRCNSASARAARRRRQSSHDLHRSVTPHTDLSQYVIDELKEDKSRIRTISDNEVSQLKASLATCEKELDELKERYKELDEECEICSQYLQERDQQCSRLKKEKAVLEKEITELKNKPRSASNSFCFSMKPSVAHASVNTDEDWTNLHSVVVDRMSYDAEVEKNKKLTKTIEELRFKKFDLQKTLDKMQKALEKNSTKDTSRELEHARQQLKSHREELDALRTRYRQLDAECEVCAAYLKERDQQCAQLKGDKASLEERLKAAETKLQEILDKSVLEHSKSVRKKRQTVHDMNRLESSAVEQTDASTETSGDVSRPEVLGDGKSTQQVQYLKKIVDRLTAQKAQLEEQLRAARAPFCVATGSSIVQNQQITDVMRENQKLKKINAKLVTICKKRGKSANRENEDPSEQ